MNVSIYQSYYRNDQRIDLDTKNFIPYNNTANLKPQLREYPLHLDLYEKHKEDKDAYWGLVSWKWGMKLRATGSFFKNWIQQNPGYDLYFVDPSITNAAGFKNSFIDGDISHPGLINFTQKVIDKLNLSIDLRRDGFHPNLFSTCTFWVGNVVFWRNWFNFWDKCLKIIEADKSLHDYMYSYSARPHLGQKVINFPFIHERFISLFLYSYNNIRWIQYPYDSKVFYHKIVVDNTEKTQTDAQGALIFYKTMYLLNKKLNYCGDKLIVPMTDEQFGHKSKLRTPDGFV